MKKELINENIKLTSEINSKICGGFTLSSKDSQLYNLFLGIGLLSNKEISNGINPAILSMAIIARQLQIENHKKGMNSKIIAMVADSHALESIKDTKLDKNKIKEISEESSLILNSLFRLLGSNNYQTILASSIKHQSHSYENMQTETLSFAINSWNVVSKIGWATKRQTNNGTIIRDEKYFDSYFEKNSEVSLRGKLAYIYGLEGLSLSSQVSKNQMQNVPPYFSEKKQNSLGYISNINHIINEISSNISTESSKQIKNFYTELGKSLKKLLGIDNSSNLDVINEILSNIKFR